MNELFRMNEHGDIWQEPTLFDQGGEVPETSSSAPVNAFAEGSRVQVVAGPYVDRVGTVDWSDDLVVCVALEPLQLWDGIAHSTFLPSYLQMAPQI